MDKEKKVKIIKYLFYFVIAISIIIGVTNFPTSDKMIWSGSDWTGAGFIAFAVALYVALRIYLKKETTKTAIEQKVMTKEEGRDAEKESAVGVILVGIIFLVLAVMIFCFMVIVATESHNNIKGVSDLLSLIFIIGNIGVAVALIFLAKSLMHYKEKGRLWGVLIASSISLGLFVCAAIGCIYTLYKASPQERMDSIFLTSLFFIPALIFGLVVFYLTRPNVKEQFK